MRVGIVGTRTRDSQQDFELVESAFLSLSPILGDTIVVSGKAWRGGDRFAEIIVKK